MRRDHWLGDALALVDDVLEMVLRQGQRREAQSGRVEGPGLARILDGTAVEEEHVRLSLDLLWRGTRVSLEPGGP